MPSPSGAPPAGYRVFEGPEGLTLELAGWTALDALARFDPAHPARVTTFGATRYGRLGWATEADLPPIHTAGEALALILQEIGLMELEVELAGAGRLHAWEGGACRFHLPDRAAAVGVIRRVAPPAILGRLEHALRTRTGARLELDAAGALSGAGR